MVWCFYYYAFAIADTQRLKDIDIEQLAVRKYLHLQHSAASAAATGVGKGVRASRVSVLKKFHGGTFLKL